MKLRHIKLGVSILPPSRNSEKDRRCGLWAVAHEMRWYVVDVSSGF